MNNIHLLPESLANQIAAGEVVQRPASVVKELLENAIDAESTDIQLLIKNAGKTLIQVIDNGIGMSETDARMCFERHATSKINTTNDLLAIRTLGFRGEAMASIAAVAQVLLKTKKKEDDTGTSIQIDASKLKFQEPTAISNSTNISVRNLFFNVPARRNFLKSNTVELKHIIEEFHRVALSNPQISISFYQDGKEIYSLKSGNLLKRIISLLGKNYQEKIIKCSEEVSQVKIYGYIGKPDIAKKTRGEQFFFVNNRFIKHPYLNHAVMSAYENLLQEKTFPFYIIFIEIDPTHIDVNVHPTKTEIKFDDEHMLYAVVRSAVKSAITNYGLTSSINSDEKKQELANTFEGRKNRSYFPNHYKEKQNQKHWEKLYVEHPEKFSSYTGLKGKQQTEILSGLQSSVNNVPESEDLTIRKKVFHIQDIYIIYPVKSGLMIIDRIAAMERIFYERFTKQLDMKKVNAQKLLFPVVVSLNQSDLALITDMKENFKRLGLIFEISKEDKVIISAVPPFLENGNEKSLLESFIEQIKFYGAQVSDNTRDQIAGALARRIASKTKKNLETEEINSIIEELSVCKNSSYIQGGTKIFTVLDIEAIGKLFLS